MKILLAYSKTFFNPGRESKYKNASAGINARVLYEVLCQYGEVDYIDVSEVRRVMGKKYDIFIGINTNFNIIRNAIYCKKSVYYAVTQNPEIYKKKLVAFKNRNKVYISNNWLYGVMKKSVLAHMFNIQWKEDLALTSPDLKAVDKIIVIGNDVTARSYCDAGLKKDKLGILSYEVMKGRAVAKKKEGNRIKVAFAAANLRLGKGFDIFYQMMHWMYQEKWKFDITIMGACDNPYYKRILDKMMHWNLNITYEGMIYDDRYFDIMKKQDFYILPSLSEGQAGTALEAMYCGVIPIVTKETGIGYYPLGALQPKMDARENYLIMKKALRMKKGEIEALSQQTVEYYNEHHLGFRERLDNMIKGLISGGI